MSKICFGYRTALKLLRDIGVNNFEAVRKRDSVFPAKAAGKANIEKAVMTLERWPTLVKIDKPVHLVYGSSARDHESDALVMHVCEKALSGNAILRFDREISICSPELAFLQVASKEKSLVSLIELAYEICGNYRTPRTSSDPDYEVDALTTVRKLREFAEENSCVRGSKQALRALNHTADRAQSPREAKLAMLLGMPMSQGGYGLGVPVMDYEVATNEAGYAICKKKHLRCDLYWPRTTLTVEYQSKEKHEGERKRIEDSRRMNAFLAMGWDYIGVTNEELNDLSAMDTIAKTIRRHTGKRNQVRVDDYRKRQMILREQLGLPAYRAWLW